jgi:hypothetical protein
MGQGVGVAGLRNEGRSGDGWVDVLAAQERVAARGRMGGSIAWQT